MRSRLSTGFAVLLTLLVLGAAPAAASDLGSARAAGQVGEQVDGYLGVVPGAPQSAADLVSEINAIRERLALKGASTRTQYPSEVTGRYPRWPGYIHCDYPSVTFTRDGRVVFIYGASDYETAGLEVGLKLVIRPIGWLYG